MVRKGNLAVFESSNISETKKVTLTKIGAHTFDINPSYLHEYFVLILFFNLHGLKSIVQKGKFDQIWKRAESLKPERPCPPNLVRMLGAFSCITDQLKPTFKYKKMNTTCTNTLHTSRKLIKLQFHN